MHYSYPTAARALCAAAALAIITGCSSSDSPTAAPPPVHSLVINPVSARVWAGDLHQLAAITRDASGAVLDGRTVTWASSRSEVAIVHADGRLEARAAGTTTISAESEGKRGELVVTVYEADIVYEGYLTGLPEMLVLSLRGGAPTRILPPHTVIGSPVPSSDGSRIAFVLADYVDWVGDIFVVDRGGSNVTRLTDEPELDDHPSWSPDGTRIAFRSHRTQYLGDIWVMNANGSNPLLLTPDALPAITDEMRPAWSPDGSRIAYSSNAGGSMNLWTMRADGGDTRQLTLAQAYDTEASWSPDGTRIVFRRGSETGSDLMVINADGTGLVALPHPGTELDPSWSPDGRLIAFTLLAAGGGSPQIYTMRPDGTESTLRTAVPAWGGGRHPRWLRRSQ
jgi:Tol biopolymer transport system component